MDKTCHPYHLQSSVSVSHMFRTIGVTTDLPLYMGASQICHSPFKPHLMFQSAWSQGRNKNVSRILNSCIFIILLGKFIASRMQARLLVGGMWLKHFGLNPSPTQDPLQTMLNASRNHLITSACSKIDWDSYENLWAQWIYFISKLSATKGGIAVDSFRG